MPTTRELSCDVRNFLRDVSRCVVVIVIDPKVDPKANGLQVSTLIDRADGWLLPVDDAREMVDNSAAPSTSVESLTVSPAEPSS